MELRTRLEQVEAEVLILRPGLAPKRLPRASDAQEWSWRALRHTDAELGQLKPSTQPAASMAMA